VAYGVPARARLQLAAAQPKGARKKLVTAVQHMSATAATAPQLRTDMSQAAATAIGVVAACVLGS
jgi:hypothetical protein